MILRKEHIPLSKTELGPHRARQEIRVTRPAPSGTRTRSPRLPCTMLTSCTSSVVGPPSDISDFLILGVSADRSLPKKQGMRVRLPSAAEFFVVTKHSSEGYSESVIQASKHPYPFNNDIDAGVCRLDYKNHKY